MKHCAKKLLGLAFALALCLAVGGTALAQTPEFADVPAALPEQEMLAYEPNVTAEPGTNTIDKLATEGYQVTIPTTVEVKSGEDKGTLEIKAQLKQYRTLNIGIESNNKWKLAYDDTTAADTPKVDYTLSEGTSKDVAADCEWQYQPDTKTLSFSTTKMQPGTSLEEDMKRVRSSSYELPITVPTPSQATMSGTYSDTVSFEFDLTKQCFTYIINVYGQEVELTSEASGTSSDFGKKYKGLQAVNMAGNANAPYTEQYVLEYGINPDGTVMGAAPGAWQHTVPTAGEKRKAVDGTEKTFTAEDAADYALRWETLDQVTIDPAGDYATSEAAGDKTKTKTIDRNLVRKWYWLDVNGATDYAGDSEDIHGNQGARISGYVNMQVSVDGTNWSSWFWQSDGDDYWGQFPYGIQFKLGFHHVKNGYVYDTGTNGGVKIIANKQEVETDFGKKEGDTTYYVYTGELTGEPTGKDLSNNVRYCYIPCYKKGITYFANGGTGGKEDVNGANKPRTNVLYQEGDELESPEQLKIAPPSTDMVFAGWSTKSTYTTGEMLYQPGALVRTVNWENYTDQKDLNKRPQLNGTQDTQKRELYAIWGYKTDIKIAFENQWGSTDKDATGVFATVQKRGFEHEKTLKTDEIVIPGQKLTLKMDDSEVIAAINTATTAVGNAATKEKIWDLAQTYTITVPQNKTATLRFEILRKRYLLNVMAVRSTGGYTVETPTGATDAAKYGKFHVKSNDKYQTSGNKVSVYQWLRNYGGSYEVCDVEANTGYRFVGFMIPATTGLTSAGDSTHITDTLTGKNSEIGYFGGDGTTYEGDTIYVVFEKVTATPGSTTPMPGPSLAPAKKALTLRYHANFDPNEELALDLDPDPLLDDMDDTFGFDPDPLLEDVDDALEGAVKTVSYQPGEDVVLRNCMFKRSGYVFVGWNTEPDGTGRLYRVNGVPITDWAAGDTVDLYAQWKKPDHLKPVVDNEPFVPTDPDTPPEELDPGFGIDPDADPADEEGPADDADAVDDAPAVADEEAAAAPPEELDFGFGIDPDAAVGGPAPFVRW
mgnify:CR=1 FL=1|jgi:uncharacterized repeat protein (TIGR02543 family)